MPKFVLECNCGSHDFTIHGINNDDNTYECNVCGRRCIVTEEGFSLAHEAEPKVVKIDVQKDVVTTLNDMKEHVRNTTFRLLDKLQEESDTGNPVNWKEFEITVTIDKTAYVISPGAVEYNGLEEFIDKLIEEA